MISYVKGNTKDLKVNINKKSSSKMQNIVNSLNGNPLKSDVNKKPKGMTEDGWDTIKTRDYILKDNVILCSTCGSSCGQCGSGSRYLNRKW